jgi:hypothetical protein
MTHSACTKIHILFDLLQTYLPNTKRRLMYKIKMSEEKNRLSYNVTFSPDHHSTIETKSLYRWTYK